MRDYDEFLHPRLQDDALATDYLKECLLDDDPRVFLVALRDVAEARGIGMKELAQKAGISREALYRALSNKGNPEWKTLHALLVALNFRLSIERAAG